MCDLAKELSSLMDLRLGLQMGFGLVNWASLLMV